MLSAIHPSLHSAQGSSSSVEAGLKSLQDNRKRVPTLLPSLTLVLVCRSRAKGEKAKQQLLREHEASLLDRARTGRKVREHWRDLLRIELETCDLSTPGGDNGLLALSRRLQEE